MCIRDRSIIEAQRLIQSYGLLDSRETEKSSTNRSTRVVIKEGMVSRAENQIKKFLSRIRDGDYLVFLSFLEGGSKVRERLSEIQHGCRDHLKIPTSLGFGPEYLHSTGQMHKGGKNTGVFILITSFVLS